MTQSLQTPPRLFTRNFTFLILGQVSSLFGNYTLKFALSMYVLEVTGSASIFAGLLSAAMIPTILLSPLGGILADRVNRRNIMVTLDLLSGTAVLLTFLLMKSHLIGSIPLIGILLIFLSILGAFESPTVQACVPQMLPSENILRGNAVVNQISAVTGLIAPFTGSIFYTAFGIEPVLTVTAACFLLTAGLECFIRLPRQKTAEKQSIPQMIKGDLSGSIHFLCKEETTVLHILLLAAVVNLFISGLIMVGFPFMVRNVLGLSATHYGVAESAMGVASIAGSLLVTVLSAKLPYGKFNILVYLEGLCLLPAGVILITSVGVFAKYIVLTLMFCAANMVCVIFSILALSAIQSRTPASMTGKVMAYVSTITMCSQPLSQMLYGFLFDAAHENAALVLLPAGLVICLIGRLSTRVFQREEL